jgi:hypothetical protein
METPTVTEEQLSAALFRLEHHLRTDSWHCALKDLACFLADSWDGSLNVIVGTSFGSALTAGDQECSDHCVSFINAEDLP